MNDNIFSTEKNREIRELQEKIKRDWTLRETSEEDEYELEIDEEDLENILERRERKNRELLKEIVDLLEDIKIYLRRL